MKTELQKVAELQGLSYDKQTKVAWGTYRGYKIAIKEDTYLRQYSFYFPIKKLETNEFTSQNDIVQNLLVDKKLIKNASYKEFSLKLDVLMTGLAKGNRDRIISVLDKVTGLANAYSYETCCEVCGGDANSSFYSINEMPFYACEECYGKTISGLSNVQAAIKQKKGNFITGIVGAFLGSLIGLTLWVIVAQLGYISGICGIVLAVCIIKGYELFGGKLNNVGIIFTVLLTIFMVYASTYISYGFAIYDTFKDTDNINIFDAIRSTKSFIKEFSEISSSYYKDLIIGYIFTAAGTISTFVTAYRNSNGKYKVKKFN